MPQTLRYSNDYHYLCLDWGVSGFGETSFKDNKLWVNIGTMCCYMMNILFNNVISGMYSTNTNRNSRGASLVWHREMLKEHTKDTTCVMCSLHFHQQKLINNVIRLPKHLNYRLLLHFIELSGVWRTVMWHIKPMSAYHYVKEGVISSCRQKQWEAFSQ